MAEGKKDPTYVVTPRMRLSYPHLFKAQDPQNVGESPKFGAAFVGDAQTDATAMKQAALAAAVAQFPGGKAEELIRDGSLKMPFRKDGDKKGYGPNTWFVNARSTQRPNVVDAQVQPILDESQVYAGCYVRASLRAFYYNKKGNQGIAFALNNVQKVADGERLDNRVAPEDEFSKEMSSDSAVGDINSLL